MVFFMGRQPSSEEALTPALSQRERESRTRIPALTNIVPLLSRRARRKRALLGPPFRASDGVDGQSTRGGVLLALTCPGRD
jgi:hypothetical protein